MMKTRIFKLLPACLGSLILTGCITFEPTIDLTRFYVLNSHTRNQASTVGKSVFVRNLTVADYLDNSQLAQREGPNQIVYLSGHRWAGSLEAMIKEIVAEEITDKHPGYSATTLSTGQEGVIIDLQVLRYDFEPGGQITLDIEYSVLDGDTREYVRHDEISRQQPLAANLPIGEVVGLMESLLREVIGDVRLK